MTTDPTDPARHPLAAAVRDCALSAQLARAALARLDSDLVRLASALAAFGVPATLAEAPERPAPRASRREAPR